MLGDVLFPLFFALMIMCLLSVVYACLFGGYRPKRNGLPINWSQLRRQAIRRANGRCEQCGRVARHLHVHHIVPRRRNGSNDLSNLKVLCPICHLKKHPNNPKLKGLVKKQIRGFEIKEQTKQQTEEEIRRQAMDEALKHAKMYEA